MKSRFVSKTPELLIGGKAYDSDSFARWEYHADNFLGMLQLRCIVILLRYFKDAL